MVLLVQLDGKLPNIALMRLAAHWRERGEEVEFRRTSNPERTLFEKAPERVYASAIFTKTLPVMERLQVVYPGAVVGGTVFDRVDRDGNIVADQRTIEGDAGVATREQDYSIYPTFRPSIGFTQRGCRLRCGFCGVPGKEGKVRPEQTIRELWRGEPWPRELILMDNDFFGQPGWRGLIADIRDGGFKVSFEQGINARMLTDEAAEAIGSVRYYDDDFKTKRIYTAWDNAKDEERLFAGLERLVKYGVKPDEIMVYMLCGYWPGETQEDREYRRRRLREFGARPYPMPYVRTPELVGFQRWVVRRGDLQCTWEEFVKAGYRPEKVGMA